MTVTARQRDGSRRIGDSGFTYGAYLSLLTRPCGYLQLRFNLFLVNTSWSRAIFFFTKGPSLMMGQHILVCPDQ